MAVQATNAEIQVEISTTNKGNVELLDLGSSRLEYGIAADTLWSLRDEFAPVVRPNGLINGGKFTPTASNDEFTIAQVSAYIGGALVTAASTTKTITRDATDGYMTFSVTLNASGTITVTAGDADASALSTTRGAAGGPPLIPVDEVEIGQIKIDSTTAAVIQDTEIFDSTTGIIDTHFERFDFPVFTVVPTRGKVVFESALPTIHAGNVAKKIFAKYAMPNLSVIQEATNFVPPTVTDTLNSVTIYRGKQIGEQNSSLNGGSFQMMLNDGITDPIMIVDGDNVVIKFYPNRFQDQHLLGHARIRIPQQYDPTTSIQSTISLTPAAVFEKRIV